MSQWDPGNRSVFFFFLSLKCFPSNFLLFLFSFFFLYLSQKGFSLFFFVILQPLSQQLSIVYSIYTWNALSPGRTIERKGLCVCGVGCRVEVFWGEIIHYTLVVPSHQREKEETSLYSLKWNKSGISPLSRLLLILIISSVVWCVDEPTATFPYNARYSNELWFLFIFNRLMEECQSSYINALVGHH